MPAKINLLNKRFGKLLVFEETNKRKNKSIVWKCKCDCGNIIELSTKNLRNDGVIQCSQCGHNREPITKRPKLNIIGKKFNHLTVLEETKQKTSDGHYLYKCQCDCENKTIVYLRKDHLINGHTKSCGCIKRKYKIGDIINNKKIIGYDKNINNHLYYNCKCLLCGYEYTTTNLNQTNSCGCLKSLGEFYINKILTENNINFKKQYSFPNSLLKYDFAILDKNNNIIKLIEFDGEQHFKDNIKLTGWNTQEKYEYTHKNDILKNNLAKQYNIPLIRIPYWERDSLTIDKIIGKKYEIKGEKDE